MYDQLPAEFVDHAKDITRVLAEMDLIPTYFSKSRFRSLSEGQQKRCVVTWLSLAEEKRNELIGQFRKTVKPVTEKKVLTEKKEKKRKIKDISSNLTIHEALADDLISESDDEEDEGDDDTVDNIVKEKPPLDIPNDFLGHYKEIILELTRLKNPNDNNQPYLQQYYAGTNFLFLVRAEQKKILKIWEKLSDQEKTKILGQIAEKRKDKTTTTSSTPSKSSANPSASAKNPSSLDSTTDAASVEASSASSKQTSRKIAEDSSSRPSAVFVSNPSKPVTTASKPAELMDSDSTEKVVRRKLNHNSSSSANHTSSSTIATSTAAPTSAKSTGSISAQKESVELSCSEILAIEDSEAEFAMKLLNANYVPLDVKETALVQLKAIQQ
eukprot:gene6659-7174_t